MLNEPGLTLHVAAEGLRFPEGPVVMPDGSIARLAGGMLWFAAYEVIQPGKRRIVPVAELATLDERASALHSAMTSIAPMQRSRRRCSSLARTLRHPSSGCRSGRSAAPR